MEREINRNRIHKIRHMLIEMANGNFTQRISRTQEDDELESLIVLINMVAEEMEETLFNSGYINRHHLQEGDSFSKKGKNNERLPKTRRSDAKLMQQVYDYILANLETPLPSLKELSRIFGTNEYNLKEGFRHFFNTSIYQFYNEERLKRIYLLIQETNIPLKHIAYMNGFNTYPNFSKAFKKKYGFSPNDLKRGIGTI